MPIVVAHQPPAAAIAQPAFVAGLGQYRQQQFQNGMQVLQVALQERARQQQMAAQQQAMYAQQQAQQQQLAADAAQRDMHMRLAQQQMANQSAMNEADNKARIGLEQFKAEQQAQNYADLRDHQSQLAETKIAGSVAEADKKSRIDALSKLGNLTAAGRKRSGQLQSDLGVITTKFAMGQLAPMA